MIELAAMLDRDPADTWTLVKRWAGRPQSHSVPEKVRRAIALIGEWDSDYLKLCIVKKDVHTSKAFDLALEAPATQGAVATLLDEGRAALDAAQAVSKARNLPRQRIRDRQVYGLLGNALGSVMGYRKGFEMDYDVQELSTRLLGAPHIIDHKTDDDDHKTDDDLEDQSEQS